MRDRGYAPECAFRMFCAVPMPTEGIESIDQVSDAFSLETHPHRSSRNQSFFALIADMAPASALILFAVAVFALVVIFRFPMGLYWRLARMLNVNDRVLIEDALKHLHDCEYRGQSSSVESLGGALQLGQEPTVRLLSTLESAGLTRSGDRGPELTDEGRRDALRVIRHHRLYERYLADRTGYQESEWHDEADRYEHTMTPQEAESIAAQTGHPRYDPHGDAIPTPDGRIAENRGKSLSALEVGESAVVVHIEDEPEAIYAQIRALKLRPGMLLRLTQNTSERVLFTVGDQEHVLAPVVAANITVLPRERPSVDRESLPRLSSLAHGDSAVVAEFSPRCRGLQRRRLLDLGLIPGTRVTAELSAPSGDPMAYRIRGALIALRRDQASLIPIQATEEDEASHAAIASR